MTNDDKAKAKKKRITEYNKIFKEISTEKKKLIKKAIEQAVHMEFQLDELQMALEKVGFVEEYQNGNNQYGKKESTESKAYNQLMKNYTAVVKILLAELPRTTPVDEDDEFKEFLMKRMSKR